MQHTNIRRGLIIILIVEILSVLANVAAYARAYIDYTVFSYIIAAVGIILIVVETVGIVVASTMASKEIVLFRRARNAAIAMAIEKTVIAICDAASILSSNSVARVIDVIFDVMMTIFILRAIKGVYDEHKESTKFISATIILNVVVCAIYAVMRLWGISFEMLTVWNPIATMTVTFIYGILLIIGNIFFYIVLGKAIRRCKVWDEEQ